jgi:putative endonuclease
MLARNYKCPAGEIDLIVTDGDMIVFVEVKSRSDSTALDHPQFDVRSIQQGRIGRAALFFLRETRCEHRPCRFDIITVTFFDTGSPRIDHFKDAFQPRSSDSAR